ncbi:MAG TPA: NUDIX domain-containing protein, partial [Dehalococcoidia bacterium]|nr:NUDIX domain-containing protein [Dehalococcoidia bacterium]
VSTARAYFERFVARFPDVGALAAASIDDVLALWAGLGYYSRAIHLHRAAQRVVQEYGGGLPEDIESLRRLPGIGRSTAGAILALSRSQRHPVLDANARRVLARVFGVDDSAAGSRARRLWELAEACTPQTRVAEYTQAIMDLGSTVCTRSRPRCDACPLAGICLAKAEGRQDTLPPRANRRPRPRRTAYALVLTDGCGRLLLQRRPPRGFWPGLWSFPTFETRAAAWQWLASNFPEAAPLPTSLPPQRHVFTHFELDLRLVRARLRSRCTVVPASDCRWHDPEAADLAATKAVALLRGDVIMSNKSAAALPEPLPAQPQRP